jgi:hypothetical protein
MGDWTYRPGSVLGLARTTRKNAIIKSDVAAPSFRDLALGDGTPKKALVTALVVGLILTAINHGDTIAQGDWPPLVKVVLTFLTPYCVTTWGAITGKRAQWRRDNAGYKG